MQIATLNAIQLSNNADPAVRNISLAGSTSANTLAFDNERRALVVGFGGAAYGAKNGNADQATLTINVLQGGGDNTYLLSADLHDYPVFSGTVSCRFTDGTSVINRIYNLKDGTIISHRGLTITTEGSNEEQSVEQWVLRFASARAS